MGPAGPWPVGADGLAGDRLELGADDAELVADLAAQEDEGDDGDDGDECKDEGVLGEALAVVAAQ